MQSRGKRGPGLSLGRQESKQRTDLFTCARDFVQYARLRETFSGPLANKDNSCNSLLYSLLCIFISLYSNRGLMSILSRWVKLRWGPRGQSQTRGGPLPPLEPPLVVLHVSGKLVTSDITCVV